jgi:UPF0755 protein
MNKKNTLIFIGILFAFMFFYFFTSAPFSGEAKIIKIEKGSNLRDISLSLKKEKIIRSRFLFESFVILFDGEKRIPDGYFNFEKKMPVYQIARRIANRNRNVENIRITIPEGFTVVDVANTIEGKLPNFNKDNFLLQAIDKEGYLFPDTYFFFGPDSEKEVLESLSSNFSKKIKSIEEDIKKSGKKIEDIIVMASIIEGEANGSADRNMISGILWKRIEKNMPLQVDVAPITYKERGLPEKPISNPGLSSILAAIYPEQSDYLFYLHQKDGQIRFAKNFEEHKKNIRLYLR